MNKFDKEILLIAKPTMMLIAFITVFEIYFQLTSVTMQIIHFTQLVAIPFLYLFAVKVPQHISKVIFGFLITGVAINSFSDSTFVHFYIFINLYCHSPVLILLEKWQLRAYFIICIGLVSYVALTYYYEYSYIIIPFIIPIYFWVYYQSLRNRQIFSQIIVFKEMTNMAERTNHEINNPLHVLSSVLKRVEKNSENEEMKKDLERAKNSLRKIESYVKKLHDL